MSHLDEGTLHALLDGELVSSDVRQVEAHLDRCTTCGTRLEEVKGVRAEADSLISTLGSPDFAPGMLAAADSVPAPWPPTAPPADAWSSPVLLIPDPPDSVLRRERRARLIGWAATLIVVVGAGYVAVGQRGNVPFAAAPAVLPDASPALRVPPADSAVVAPEEVVEKSADSGAAPAAPTPELAQSQRRQAQAPPADAADIGPVTPQKKAVPVEPTRLTPVAEAAARELARIRQSEGENEGSPQPGDRTLRRLRGAAATADVDRARREAEMKAAAREAEANTPRPTPRPALPPPSLDDRADVYLRIGLDEAKRQLGSPMHVIEGMTPALIGLAQGRLSAGMDTTRPVVRAVYVDPANQLILLDQQRLRPGQTSGATTQLRSLIGDVIVQLHGEPSINALRNLASRIQ